MRAGWLCIAAAGLLLSGCASIGALTGGGGQGVQAQAHAQPDKPEKPVPWYARSSGCSAWDDNAYHYECDPNANY